MKKYLLVLGMITCIFGLTGCASKKEEVTLMSVDEAIEIAEQGVEDTVAYFKNGNLDEMSSDIYYDLFLTAVASYEGASEDIGDYIGIVGSTADVDEETAVVSVEIEGTEHNAIVEVIIDEDGLTQITTNVVYTFGESMEKAALNTLIGMGTVFVVLILICLIISSFKVISVFENRKKKKEQKKVEEAKKAEAPAAPVATPVVAEASETEDLTSDLELVAVIAAAIAASEGQTTTDGFVVRSIRKANKNKWQKAI